ncbi:uncharacterized protein METZ01_LOCUS357572 [marine metagenome]|uniref:Uncharacterized protein n=1 Tax=marine metagenome TaxID=408172 RepID=A0A382S6E3_9ZZZZ
MNPDLVFSAGFDSDSGQGSTLIPGDRGGDRARRFTLDGRINLECIL